MSSSTEPRRQWLGKVAFLLLARSSFAQQGRRLPPPEPKGEVAELEALLDRIREIVVSKNSRALLALMQPDFRVEFDVGKGPRVFQKHWTPESPDSPVWEILARALALEGSFPMDSLFCIPYLHISFPKDLDPLAYVVACSDKTALREQPAADGTVVATLDRSIVRLSEPISPPAVIRSESYISIDDPDAGRGYIAGSEVYSPAGHRLFFHHRQGKWRWISLAAATLADPPDEKHP